MDLMVSKGRLGKERYIKQINDFWECYKKTQLGSTVRRKKAISEKNLVEVCSFV